MATITKTRQWGNSLGIIIPKGLVNNLSLVPNEEVSLDISKRSNVLKELFGSLPAKKKSDDILKKVRKDLESKWE